MIEKITAKLAILLQGKIPEKMDTEKITDEQEQNLANMLNQLISFVQEIHDFVIPLSKGELSEIKMLPQNFFASPFKELHSRLFHLTWQAKQVENGDFSQRVDFMGDFSEAFNAMIVSLANNENVLKRKIDELEKALSHIQNLEGILPICSNCKKIRLAETDPKKQNSWVPIETYISEKTEAQFSHGICPECMKKLYPDFM